MHVLFNVLFICLHDVSRVLCFSVLSDCRRIHCDILKLYLYFAIAHNLFFVICFYVFMFVSHSYLYLTMFSFCIFIAFHYSLMSDNVTLSSSSVSHSIA